MRAAGVDKPPNNITHSSVNAKETPRTGVPLVFTPDLLYKVWVASRSLMDGARKEHLVPKVPYPYPDIFSATDYRQFLTDWLRHRDGRPSQNRLAHLARCTSAQISLIRQGTRNLTEPLLSNLLAQMRLTANEEAFFRLLVRRDDHIDLAERRSAAASIEAVQGYRKAAKVSAGRESALASPISAALIEMAGLTERMHDSQWVASKIVPPQDPEVIETLMRELEASGLLARDEAGVWRATHGDLATSHDGAEGQRAALRELHLRALCLASDAIVKIPAQERHLGATFVALDQAQLVEARALLTSTHEQLLALGRRRAERATGEAIARDPTPRQVVLVCTQLFPMTERL